MEKIALSVLLVVLGVVLVFIGCVFFSIDKIYASGLSCGMGMLFLYLAGRFHAKWEAR